MHAHIAACLSATVLVLMALLHFAAVEVAPLELYVRPKIAFAPSDVNVQIRLQPNRANREVRISTDSGSFARASQWTVDDEHAQRLYSVWWRDLPSGQYRVIAEVASYTHVLFRVEDSFELLGQ